MNKKFDSISIKNNNQQMAFKKNADRLFFLISMITLSLFSVGFIVLFIYMIIEGVHGFTLGGFSLTKKIWDPQNGKFGIATFIVSSLFVLALGICFATPCSLGFALFSVIYLNKKTQGILNAIVELLSGVPSVVFGIFGYFVLIKAFNLNFSILSASIILSFMILPLIILFLNINLNIIPKNHLYASLALGATKTETAFKIYVSSARHGLVTGLIAGVTRILGETIAVTMLIGGNTHFPSGATSSSSSLTSIIAYEFREANGDWRSALFSIGLIILLIVVILNIITLIIHRQIINYNKRINNEKV